MEGLKMSKITSSWWSVYENLNLYDGKLQTISDDSEDMLTITYPTGLIIDVGYIALEKRYYITVVKNDSVDSWNSPIMKIEVYKKSSLAYTLQNTIQELHNLGNLI
jgi:hypothetical protein